MINCIAIVEMEWLSNYLFVFGLSACDICNEPPHSLHTGDFGGISKQLITNCLNFTDTNLGRKAGLNGPERTCKRVTIAMQLWPFQLLTVALLQVWRARMRKPVDLPGGLKPIFSFGWNIFAEVFLSVLFVTIRQRESPISIGVCPTDLSIVSTK